MKDTPYKLIFICLLTLVSFEWSRAESTTNGRQTPDSPPDSCINLANNKEERVERVKMDSALIRFHQSQSTLDVDYMDNGRHIGRMLDYLRRNAATDSALRISSIKVVGAASPEGSVGINASLSRKRADLIFEYFSERTDLPDSITGFRFIGRDWEGLQSLVESDYDVPMREEVISLLDEIQAEIRTSGHDSEANLLRLKKLGHGKPYAYMYKELFPLLRFSRLYVEYSYLYPEKMRQLNLQLSGPDISVIPSGNIILLEDAVEIERPLCRPFYMGLKTNMLYDALALPSVGAEFYIGRQWSIVGNWTYGWWDRDRAHRYWRAYGGDIALRKWIGKRAAEKPLTGHHVGAYAGVVTYDFEFGGKGYMGGLPGKTLWDRCNYMAGVEYGYSLPVARRLNIDFTLGIGCLWGKQVEYKPEDGAYVWQKTRNFTWVGPTKAEVSLVWLIGCDNYNRKFTRRASDRKGGER